MKNNFIAICWTTILSLVISCNKTQTNVLVGRWNIVNDSSSLPIANTTGDNYIGTSNDYYNFTVNGAVYIKESSQLDTATYLMKTNNEIDFTFLNGNFERYYIANLTGHAVTFKNLLLLGSMRIINLKK